jgi:hypothetical protein
MPEYSALVVICVTKFASLPSAVRLSERPPRRAARHDSPFTQEGFVYTRPTLVRFGTLRELTLGGSSANYDFANASNNTCDRTAPECWVPIPNPRS